ncbi:MAG: hypothetical protein IKA61_02330 [Clostridia bacterium]|nr:hypothetical protein [Clostridia bacterium]
MNKKTLLKFSLINFIIGIVVFAISYFTFHFITNEGITFIWHAEAGKPFVTDMIAQLGVLFVFASAISLVSALVFFNENNKKQ